MNVSSINQYSRTQHDYNVNGINREQESVAVEYSSVDSYYDHLLYAAIREASVFLAFKLIHEASELNGGKGLPENYMRKVKMHFIKKDRQQNEMHFPKNKVEKLEREELSFPPNEIVNNEISKIKVSRIETHFAGIEFHNRQRENIKVAHNEKLRKEMLKGYMGLLSESIECRV